PRDHPSSAVRPRRHGLWRAERLLPADGQARDIRPSERGQRRAAVPQRRGRISGRAGDRGARCDRGNRRLQATGHVVMYLAGALLVVGFFPAVSALESFVLDRRARTQPLGWAVGQAFNIVGAVFALFIASYTGVLLSVSNQPIWSDTWMLGGLFLASGLSGSAALIALLTRYRPDAAFSLGRLHEADGYFSILELVLLVAFFITIIAAGTAGM